jgi:tRNA G18 (ribose-2'-O)-methylase SpoU
LTALRCLMFSLTAHQDSSRLSVPAEDLQRLDHPQGGVPGLRDPEVKSDDTAGRAEASAVGIAEVEALKLQSDVVVHKGCALAKPHNVAAVVRGAEGMHAAGVLGWEQETVVGVRSE